MLQGLTSWVTERTEHGCQIKGNGEGIISSFWFHFPCKKKGTPWEGKPCIPRSQCTPQLHPRLESLLRFAGIYQTPLFNPKPCPVSDLSQKTPHNNTRRKKANELFCQEKMICVRQRLRNSAQSHRHPLCALRDEPPPSSGPACVGVGAR